MMTNEQRAGIFNAALHISYVENGEAAGMLLNDAGVSDETFAAFWEELYEPARKEMIRQINQKEIVE